MTGRWADVSMRTGFYRTPAQAKIAGVCAGIAERMGIKRFWVRAGFVVFAVVTHGFGIALYLLLAILMTPREDVYAPAAAYGGYAAAGPMPSGPMPVGPPPGARVMDVRARFTAIDARLSRIEAVITSNELSLRRKFRDLGSD